MTNEELRAALLSGEPVTCNDIVYSRVSAVIYRRKVGGVRTQAELLDKSAHSVTIAAPDRVSIYKEGSQWAG